MPCLSMWPRFQSFHRNSIPPTIVHIKRDLSNRRIGQCRLHIVDSPLRQRLPQREDMAAIEVTKSPGPPPRALTPAVRRRSLIDPRVRFWWIAAVILLVSVVYFLITQLLKWK